jgi:hypothetical protein
LSAGDEALTANDLTWPFSKAVLERDESRRTQTFQATGFFADA